jgi:hypothetical protein
MNLHPHSNRHLRHHARSRIDGARARSCLCGRRRNGAGRGRDVAEPALNLCGLFHRAALRRSIAGDPDDRADREGGRQCTMTRTWPPSCDEATTSIVTPPRRRPCVPASARPAPRTPVPDAAGCFRLGGQIVAYPGLFQSDEALRQARREPGVDGGRHGTANVVGRLGNSCRSPSRSARSSRAGRQTVPSLQ